MELDFLKNQASVLQQQINQIQKRIDEIEKEEKPKKKSRDHTIFNGSDGIRSGRVGRIGLSNGLGLARTSA